MSLVSQLRDAFHPCAIRNRFTAWMARRRFRHATARRGPYRLVVGASGTAPTGWIGAEVDTLDIRKAGDWEHAFTPGSLDHILAEHVWEHLAADEGQMAAQLCFRFLAPGGLLRIAVPDGFHPDPGYLAAVAPDGTGPGADDHRVLYTQDSLCSMLCAVGFQVTPLEWFDATGTFHAEAWDEDDGPVSRSLHHDPRNQGLVPRWTSLIVDARRPVCPP